MIELPRWPVADETELALLREVLGSSQWGGFHPILGAFEREFASYQQTQHGVAAVNGTVTIEMMLAAAGVGAGDEVIVPAISFVSTATAVSRIGAVPVFADIEPYSFNIDPNAARAGISAKTKAIMAVHFGGALANVDALMSIAQERSLLFFEDAAHAHGSEWRGRRAGSFGFASSFSFQNGKVMTAGEGGIALTNDSDLAARMRSFANQGRRQGHSFYHHFEIGNNYRMTALQAAVLTAQLHRLDEQIALRSRNAKVFFEGLAGYQNIVWQEIPNDVTRNAWYLILGRMSAGESRDEFHRRVLAAGIPCTPFYPHPLYGNPLYRDKTAPCRVLDCPNAEACIRDAFWIGFRALMGDEETTRRVARLIAEPG